MYMHIYVIYIYIFKERDFLFILYTHILTCIEATYEFSQIYAVGVCIYIYI